MEPSAAAATIALVLVAWLALALIVALFLGAMMRRRDAQPELRQEPNAQTPSYVDSRQPADL
ncbi:hypothetical protein SAMN06295879_0463 [Agreia bicolorata]|uniref:Uncharacterized protein n=1 Tax=Agreia bicolorata TaxID=110935 RepID=A0A1T4WYI4_9MICO|nr:hypothetical protein [Agreia bicolorata]SKA82309.1 hypothetical protein SAMN06295879_0463 [Agreia bicolorata]